MSSIATPEGYRALAEDTVAAYLAGVPALRDRLGDGGPGAWRVREVGDGNLNLVFIVEGPAGDLCVKQALPYVRLVGESWPLPLKRAWYEHEAASIQARHAAARVPELLHYDERLYLIAMERLHPHVIMRRGMIEGVAYPDFAAHMAEYLAATLYYTSDLALPAVEKKELIARFSGNTELCKITEDLIFTDPYMLCDRNRWTSPQLDDDARAVREDAALKRAVSALKLKFLSEAQALLHGDLHTGSIMITSEDTRVIDPEFAFVGPMGFDVGKLLGNLLMSFLSQRGHEDRPGGRDAYRAWILETVEGVWDGFERRFVRLWDSYPSGDAYPRALFDGPEGKASLKEAQRGFMRRLFGDALGFAGAAMIRRTLGLAHNIDMEWIRFPDLRAACERRNLRLARELVVGAAGFADVRAVTARAREVEGAG
jgi:5-methylthioribose kinase